jgi:hypothetical protein
LKVWAKLTPSIGAWVTPRMVAGGWMPRASSTVGTRSMMCPYWVRISPRAVILAGQEMMHGSVVPPRYVSRFQRRNGVFPALVHPQA